MLGMSIMIWMMITTFEIEMLLCLEGPLKPFKKVLNCFGKMSIL